MSEPAAGDLKPEIHAAVDLCGRMAPGGLEIRLWLAMDELESRRQRRYSRSRDLHRLLPELRFAPPSLLPNSPAIAVLLHRAMLRERTLGLQGHRAYNPARHMALAAAWRAEIKKEGATSRAAP